MATGRKTVVVGQVIDPDTWGNLLWDQSVQTFASAASRTGQFAAPKLGAVTWLDDVKLLQYWDGTTWLTIPSSKPVVVACPLNAAWSPPSGYSAPRLSLVSGRWMLTATWQNLSAGTFSAGYADLLTIPAGARVATHTPFQAPCKWAGFAFTASSFVDVNPSTGLVRWFLPAAAAGATAAQLSGGMNVSWDASL